MGDKFFDFSTLSESCKKRIACLLVTLLVIFASAPVLQPLNWGHDLLFHLYRIEGIAEGLKDGVFPVRMQYSQIKGMGYPVSIMYPDIFLYFPAILRCLGLGQNLSYRIFLFAVNVFVVLTTYIFTKRFTGSRVVSFTLTCVWVLGTYRLVDVYLRHSVGEYLALAFFPMIAYGLWCAFSQRGKQSTKISACIWIALGMTGIVLSHVLSVILAVFAIGGVLVVLAFKGDRKKQGWLHLLGACGITVLLCAWFIVPFFSWSSMCDMGVFHIENTVHTAGEKAGTLGQLLAIFPTFTGQTNWSPSGAYHKMPQALGLGGMCLVCAALLAFFATSKSAEKDDSKKFYSFRKFSLLIALIFLFICTCLCCLSFLWKERIPFMKLLANVQFPWRFLGPILFISVVLGVLVWSFVKGNNKAMKCFKLFCALVCALTMIEGGHSMTSVMYEHSAQAIISDLEASENFVYDDLMNAEYLPYGMVRSDVDEMKRKIVADNFDFSISHHADNGRVFDIEVDEVSSETTLELPLIYYAGYEIVTENAQDVTISTSDTGFVQLEVPSGVSGDVSLKWFEPGFWRIAEIGSLISILALICLISWQCCKRH